MMNPQLYDQELIEKLCEMSKRCFGTKWRFRKLSDKHGLSIEEIEKQMQAIVDYQEAELERLSETIKSSRTSNDND